MDTGNTGYGLFARQDMFSGAILGPYSGAFIPENVSNTSDYLTNIWTGLWSDDNFSEGTIDALHAGSAMRFINSSCIPNAILEHSTVGMDLRIVVVKLIKNVKAGEQIFLNYGAKYFTNGKYCRCGKKQCNYLESGSSDSSSSGESDT
jgi:SET domain-containing protein